MNEIWTAKEKTTDDNGDMIVFDVLNELNGEVRQEKRYASALSRMFADGGYPPATGAAMAFHDLPWRFRKIDGRIYLDGLSIRCPTHHPIDTPSQDTQTHDPSS